MLFLTALLLPLLFSAFLLGLSVTLSRSAGGFASVSGQVTVSDSLGVEAAPASVPAAQPATLTTRTDASHGTLTMGNALHGIVTGQRLDLYWPAATTPGQTFNVTAGTVAGTSVPFTCNTVGLSAPAATGLLSQVAAGALGGTTYYVKITYVNANGETLGGTEANIVASANNVLVVASPPAAGAGELAATGWNVYVSNTAGGGSGTETKQNGTTPIAIGTAWVEPTTGLVAGAALPGANTTGANLPPATTAVVVGVPVQVTFPVVGPNLTALLLSSPQQSFFCFDTGATDDLAVLLQANQGYAWCNADPYPNPFSSFTTSSVWMSHSYTAAAVTSMQAAALTH